MWLTITDTKRSTDDIYFIPDAPARLFLTEETQHTRCRFVYRISRVPLDGAREISFSDFISILFFDLAFEPISDTLYQWITSVTE